MHSGSLSGCQHKTLHLAPSPFAPLAGYVRPDARHLVGAEALSGKLPPLRKKKSIEKEARELEKTFPAPLVLPWDELNLDPEYDGQSFKEWRDAGKSGSHRNTVKGDRSVLYIGNVRTGTSMESWTRPVKKEEARNTRDARGNSHGKQTKSKREDEQDEKMERSEYRHQPFSVDTAISDIIKYLSAFYHGMTVRQISNDLHFTHWNNSRDSKRSVIPKYIGLANASTAVTRIRLRSPSPDSLFPVQLNLNDILDAAIEMLPSDAYALVLLVDHDMYEDASDDFCIGRAYGGSRVAVVSSGRYRAFLDDDVDLEHMWPASHCAEYVEEACRRDGGEDVVSPHPKEKSASRTDQDGALRAAISAALRVPPPASEVTYNALCFSLLCRTVSHELGHCFGIDHCVYYACCMQGAASITEDLRQPPYLCPVCLMKVSYAIASELQSGDEKSRKEYISKRYRALLEFCEDNSFSRESRLFIGFQAWLNKRLNSLERIQYLE